MRRVSWASTRRVSTSRVAFAARWMASLVISWKTMRLTGTFGWVSSRCQAMASPSRSSSVAVGSSAFLSRALSSRTFFFLSASTT